MKPNRTIGRSPGPCALATGSAGGASRPAGLPALLLLLVAAAGASAQPAPSARPDPLDPAAAVPAATYASPMARQRPASETAPASWRESNETVNRIGGWRVYAREAQPPQGAPATASPMPAAPSSTPHPASPPIAAPAAPHGGHGHHGRHGAKPQGATP